MKNNKLETLIRIKKNFQITLPGNIRKKMNVSEGDFVNATIDNLGGINIRPVKMIDPSQAYYWTKEWQQAEKEADDDIKNGRVSGPFKNAKEVIHHLNSL
ncbi:MAG: Transcriptional regulator, AbrB family [Candidatus Falkowbacteria bacterium GW2011_GWC2_38_22]|uniref:Transcriptional regulator, AbrB family n=1 Tax=Candidatus Falkowbacteria bacterium GW2011_GWE1_38_31 TaxID=1618638 RepID=A0A0G0JQA8_9BACT|nr:MAG: Transcriptional regulator, AbrB family [Candidatus Falkowbacteria bacterium GW2011_GWF2_38_1205]KKQ60805.1 MAG: Transcriptional regulator, AbrB family [Candidatus Falkowbacteria bacterium GW2011_GWC2_38_22]KKQ62972.1 MAG: Transcriptional regulator, AbrB family [Candidatus Falkowbacteria bacterium GW2011_GWF1_38_22]KKQ64984.1 MAG: Transcriptional regulator, AbrB family [Candidatus Falkowbacteria bacterium GW2011_GWE2_38_254]KKQ69748.1 MAG: Transcriptional regulator, AbrB family [Candidat